jgi:hypothetical protein
MPLGILYFVLIDVGFSVGLGTLILWIGLPILLGTFIAIRGMAALERRLVVTLLHYPLRTRERSYSETRPSFLHYLRDMVRDPLTWTSTVYMFIKLPIGIVSFTLALVLPILSAAITLLPLVYLINLFVNGILLKNGIASTSYILPNFIEIHGTFDPIMFARTFIFVPVGVGLAYVSLIILNGLALGSAELARVLLTAEDAPAMPKQPSRVEMPMMSSQYNRD